MEIVGIWSRSFFKQAQPDNFDDSDDAVGPMIGKRSRSIHRDDRRDTIESR